jgi:hypothetical protein
MKRVLAFLCTGGRIRGAFLPGIQPADFSMPRPPSSHFLVRRARARGGVVLMEALLALAVFAVAVVGLARCLDSAVTNAREARTLAAVTRSMENALEEALHRPAIEVGSWTAEPDGNGLVVTTAYREAEMESGEGQLLGGLFEVEVTGVLPARGKNEQVWQLKTLCYPPLYAAAP